MPILLWAFCIGSLSAPGDAFSANTSLTVAAKSWRAVPLRRLLTDSTILLTVTVSKPVNIAIVQKNQPEPPLTSMQPLLIKRVYGSASFTVNMAGMEHHYLIIDNRQGDTSSTVSLATHLLSLDKLDQANETLAGFEKALHRLFEFDSIKIAVIQCDAKQPLRIYTDTRNIFICTDYIVELHDTIADAQDSKDILLFSLFHEIAHVLLNQWGYPFYESEETADHFAAAALILLNQKKRLQGVVKLFTSRPLIADVLTKIYRNSRHPLSLQRARNIMHWMRDKELLSKWQTVFVPHMHREVLLRLKNNPPGWADPALIRHELEARRE